MRRRSFLLPCLASLFGILAGPDPAECLAPVDPNDSVLVTPSRINPLHPLFTTSPPVIDGVLDDPVWKTAPHVTGFKTFMPDFDIVPKEQTDVALAYDRENIYFAFRCYDVPGNIKATVSPRDKITTDDFICINLDAFNDQQALTAFYVNPLGMQADSRFSANNEDFSPDFVWYSAGRIDSLGYTVEVQLPLKSLRYTSDEPTVMGVILERFISRRSEHSSFPRLDPAKGNAFLTQMYPIAYSGIEHYTLLEILPAVTATRQDVRNGTALEKSKQDGELSLTAKYGLSSSLILDGTVNPDFSQVESDAGQVDINLRYSLYYPEKRPFFLEGIDNFNIAANANLLDPAIYYSRTIADPALGVKLTGKIGTQTTLAALYAEDNVLEADRPVLGRYAQVPVVRYKRSLSDDSYLGFLYVGRELEHTNNRVAGYDEQFRVSDAGVLESNGYLSWAKDDPSKPSVDGNTFGLRYASSTRNFDYNLNYREISENFRADMGYVARTGFEYYLAFARPKFYPSSKSIQRIDLEFSSGNTRDRYSGLWETLDDAAFNLYFFGSWLFRTRVAYATEIFDGQRFQNSGVHTQLRAQITKELFVNLLYRRIRATYYATPEQGRSNVVNADVVLQPRENIQLEGTYVYSDFTSDATGQKLYQYPITRLKLTYQVNSFLFFRGIAEYNDYKGELSPQFLASFTYIPGTAVYLGYGSVFDRVRWGGTGYVNSDSFLEMQRGLFMKLSYLWRS